MILDSITQQYNTLTKSAKKLANFLLANAEEAQYLSITSLAKKCGVSESTITRFCHALGLSGYNELKIDLAKSVLKYSMDNPKTPPSDRTDFLYNMCKTFEANYSNSFRETADQLNPYEIGKATDLIAGARRVYCFGQGSSMIMALHAYSIFSTISPNFTHIIDSHMQIISTSLATSDDLILFFSYSGSTKDMMEVFELAKKKSVPIILVTHFPNSEGSEYADVTLICGYNESPLQPGSMAAKIGQLLIIDCLYTTYCNKNPILTSKAKENVASAVAGKLL